MMPRTDGQGLMYSGKIHSFHGESESGKSMLLLWEAVRIIMSGEGEVLWLDFDSDAQEVISRLKTMGLSRDKGRMFHYVKPEEPLKYGTQGGYLQKMVSRNYRLAVIDGVNDALSLYRDDKKGDPNDKYIAFSRDFVRNLMKHTDATIAIIDHVVKDVESRGRFAIGAQAKMSQLTGAAYYVHVEKPFGREMTGEIHLRIAKDRPGGVRASGGRADRNRMQTVAIVTVANDGKSTTLSLDPDVRPVDPFEMESKDDKDVAEQVISYLMDNGESGTNEICRGVGGTKSKVIFELKRLTDEKNILTSREIRGSRGRPRVLYSLAEQDQLGLGHD
jgi:AAA domain